MFLKSSYTFNTLLITTLKAVVGRSVGVYVGASGEGTSVVGASVVGTSVGAPVEDYYVYIIINVENKL